MFKKSGRYFLMTTIAALTIFFLNSHLVLAEGEIYFDGYAMTLENLEIGDEYSYDQTNWNIADNTWVPVDEKAVTASRYIYVRPPSQYVVMDPVITTIRINQATTPAGLTVTHPTGNNPNGSINGTTVMMEYKSDKSAGWTPASSDSTGNLYPGTYLVRTLGGFNTLPSTTVSLTLTANNPVKEPTPNATFDAATMQLSNIPSRSSYSVDGGILWNNAAGSASISYLSPSTGIRLFTMGNGSTTMDSDNQYINITKPSPPNVTVTNPTTNGGTGSINQVNSSMQWCVSGSSNWQNINDNVVNGLQPGNYDVRFRAAGTSMASDTTTVTIKQASLRKENTPNATFDAASMKLSNVSSIMQYSVDGGASFYSTGNGPVVLSNVNVNNGIKVKALGDGRETTDSDVQTITLTCPSAPSVAVVQPTSVTGKGQLIQVDNTMQYKLSGSNNWIDITSNTVSGLSPDKYDVRFKASGTRLASPITTVSIYFSLTKETTPAASFNAQTFVLSNLRQGDMISLDGGASYMQSPNSGDISLTSQQTKINTRNGIRVFRPGNRTTTADSDMQIITIAQASVPNTIYVTNATATTKGRITGVSSDMEYSSDNGNTWSTVTGNSIENLQKGIYLIRVKAKTNMLASDAVSIAVGQTSQPTPQPTASPTVKPAPNPTAKPVEPQKTDTPEPIEPVPEPVPDDNDPPYVPDVGIPSEDEWSATLDELLYSPPGSTVTIDMTQHTNLPAYIIASTGAANQTLILNMGDDVHWKIDGKTVSNILPYDSIDMNINQRHDCIPGPLKLAAQKAVSGLHYTQFDIAYDGDLGFEGLLVMNIGSDYSQKKATLFYFNESCRELIPAGNCTIDSDGEVRFFFTHASSYLVMVSEKPYSGSSILPHMHSEDVLPTANEQPTWVFVLLFGIITIMATLTIVFVAYTHRRRRR